MRTALLGATGLVGRTMLAMLETRGWVDEPPLLLTSARTAWYRPEGAGPRPLFFRPERYS